MIELHMKNGEMIRCEGITLKQVKQGLSGTPVFLQVSKNTLVRAEEISAIQEVDDYA